MWKKKPKFLSRKCPTGAQHVSLIVNRNYIYKYMIHVLTRVYTQKFGFVYCCLFQLANFEARGDLDVQFAAVVSAEAVIHCWVHLPSFAMKKKVRLKMERNSFDCAKSCLRLRFEIWLLVPRAQVRHLWSKYSTSMLLLGLFSWDVGPIGSAIIPPGLLVDFSSKQNMLIQFPPKNMLIQFPSTECRLTVWIFKQLC